jgi:hypothetical protein
MRRWRRIGSRLLRWLALGVLAVLLVVVAAMLVVQTGWGHDRLRRLIVSQANRYLTATLDIGRLGGSIVRGIELDDVRVSRAGEPIIAIDRVTLSYSIRELIEGGTLIRSLSVDRPRIVAAKQTDGRWDIAALVRPRNPQRPRQGSGRLVRIQSIAVHDGSVTLKDPLSFGAAHVPTSFTHLETALSFVSEGGRWTLSFDRASFDGGAPDLIVRSLSGDVGNGDDGWRFGSLRVVTPRSEFTLDGQTEKHGQAPTELNLAVSAPRFAFQEWSGVLNGLRNIAIESAFDAHLAGPVTAMRTNITLTSNGGDVRGDLVLDTSIPGWHATGTSSVQRLDLSRWLNRPDRPSDISGTVDLDLDLQLGGHFPKGAFTFRGSHTAYMNYEADNVVARGSITATDVRIAAATAFAYGSSVRLSGSTLAIDAPYGFHFVGTASGVDLRQVPTTVPVPHVESTLAFDYDVVGQFTNQPFIRGTASFDDSTFLDAQLGAGSTGFIDTQAVPFHYAGEGELSNVDLNHFGERLDIAWLTDPRYSGTVRGRFNVDGTGSDLSTMTLSGGGRLERADLFDGVLSDADVSVSIANGSLEGSYDGALSSIDPSIPMADPLYAARLTGHARGRIAVADLLVRSPLLEDYTMDGELTAEPGTDVRGIAVTSGTAEATLSGGTLRIVRLETRGPAVDVRAEGTLELDGERSSALDYWITRSDLAALTSSRGTAIEGDGTTSGRLTGPLGLPRFEGEGEIARFTASGVSAQRITGTYDVTVPTDDPSRATAHVNATLSSAVAFQQPLESTTAELTYDAGRVTTTVTTTLPRGIATAVHGTMNVDMQGRQVDVDTLTLDVDRTSWRLAAASRPHIAWTGTGVAISSLDLVDTGSAQQHVEVAGTWEQDGSGRLRIGARDISLDALTAGASGNAARYGGVLNATADVSGTEEDPVAALDFAITDGRVRRLAYQKLGGHVDYRGRMFQVDVRLDQATNTWLTAVGSVPLSVFDRSLPEQPIDVAVKSSPVSLTLIEGVTDVVRNVAGQMELDVRVIGSSQDPHFSGRVSLANAGFEVVSSGARYHNGRLLVELARDRVTVDTLHLEDEDGHPLEVTGSLGTHELRVGNLQVEVNARGFQVLRNEYGRMSVDAQLNYTGEFESPRLSGRITVTGGTLQVDNILDRALFQPYSTQAAPEPSTELDPIVALNPWQRMGLDIELHIPGTLRMSGENVQVTPGTPLGLGDISLRAFGDLYLYKDPAQPMYVTGSLDSVTGTYAFQGRQFDLDPASSINFRGDLNPELYVTVNREISGVQTRVSIFGSLQQPELRLASTPPLDPSDILSLIVFNTSTNDLSALQQEQLAVRAGTLAAGFLAAPMVSALERTLGIDTLEIEPGTDIRGGPRVTVGNEIAPGLVARFSRQFGEAEYDEATLEYYLSRILRIRATFSDAGALIARSPFRRIERAGIDLLLLFSF